MLAATVVRLLVLPSLLVVPALGFTYPQNHVGIKGAYGSWGSRVASDTTTRLEMSREPQVWSCGYSPKTDLLEAIQEAAEMAADGLPRVTSMDQKIDLAMISISSLYDGQSNAVSPSMVVPAVLSSGATYGSGIQHLIGCTAGGIVSSLRNYFRDEDGDNGDDFNVRACNPIESEGIPGVSITFAILPDVNVKTFHVLGEDVPDDYARLPVDMYKSIVGLKGFKGQQQQAEEADRPDNAAFCLLPSPSFQTDLDEFLRGLEFHFPSSSSFGGIASTVSSLSRARLFRYDASDPQASTTYGDGCVGVGLSGDIAVRPMIAQGAKPVGGIYRIVTGEESTIRAIILDESATQEADAASAEEAEEEEDDEDSEEDLDDDVNAKMAAAYAKAMIPKPILAEANFLMRTLSDDDQSFMRKALLVGIEGGGSFGRSPNELARLAEGQGHRFTVFQVASAGMKDGSVTFPLGAVNVSPGTRMRFFVRESGFGKREVEALVTGYKKKVLESTMAGTQNPFNAAGCLLVPTLDRGSKFFGGKPGFESSTVTGLVPSLPSVWGFFSNGALGRLDDGDAGLGAMVHGSASSYVLLGSATGRPIYDPVKAAEEEAAAQQKAAEEAAAAQALEAEDAKRQARSMTLRQLDEKAPRDERGELILKRREVHSGRAISVSTVEWSVAEKTATPTSALEGYMWDKETEVDRFRERVPLSNLVSQCRLSSVDPTKPKPRDWIGPLKRASTDGFVFIPECKRIEPLTGSLRKRYDVVKLAKQFVLAGSPAISVNCDPVMFGGTLEDVTKAREAASRAALSIASDDGIVVPPILASDLILYPYQLYRLHLAGADAVNLVAGALASKDLLYLTKIASSLQLQALVTVTTERQIEVINQLPSGCVKGLIVSNRELEDFGFDMTGQQALDLLKCDALQAFYEKHGADTPVLVEGRVGIIEWAAADGVKSTDNYIEALKSAGALGAIMAGGIAAVSTEEVSRMFQTA